MFHNTDLGRNRARRLCDLAGAVAQLQDRQGAIAAPDHPRAQPLLQEIAGLAADLAAQCGQPDYGRALVEDLDAWERAGLDRPPDFSASRDALAPPEDGRPFFFLGPLRLANGGRAGWSLEAFLSLREEPASAEYQALYRRFPHPKNICQSSHLLIGSPGLVEGNNIVFFPENIRATAPLAAQNYAVFFFNKFHRIFNEITLPTVAATTAGAAPENPTGADPRANYLARCVWGYLHDYFHHRGPRPFDEAIGLKTKWFAGLLEEIKVDLETYLACRAGDLVDGAAVAEFILYDRAFRYPMEPDWHRNFDSGTGLLLLSVLHDKGAMRLDAEGLIRLDTDAIPAVAEAFVAEIAALERLDDAAYLAVAKSLVRRYLPEGADGARIGLPACLAGSVLARRMAGPAPHLRFDRAQLLRSVPAETQNA